MVFGHVVSGRNITLPGIDKIFGAYRNVVPVRVSFDQISTVLSLLTLIQEQYLASMRHENLGLRTTIEECTDWPGWTRLSSTVNHQNYTNAGTKNFSMGEAQCSSVMLILSTTEGIYTSTRLVRRGIRCGLRWHFAMRLSRLRSLRSCFAGCAIRSSGLRGMCMPR